MSILPFHKNEDLGQISHPSALKQVAHQTHISEALAELHNPQPRDGSSPSDGRKGKQIDYTKPTETVSLCRYTSIHEFQDKKEGK
jgi:hypothetical protein